MAADALELALALWRAPSRRASLHQRPLPRNLAELIPLAAGSPERLSDAAARTGEPPERILEAARFYLREMLLFEGADAYRLLGVANDCSDGEIKANHRALQLWLHPDRNGDDWESLYAGRINAAWAELRSPQRRAAYDARQLDGVGVEPTRRGVQPRRVLVTGWRAEPAPASAWPRWLALAVVVGAGVWLAVIVYRQDAAPDPRWQSVTNEPAPRPRAANEPVQQGTTQEAAGMREPSAGARQASARIVGRQLLAYLASRQAQDPPAWRGVSALHAAVLIRQRLGSDSEGDEASWRTVRFAEPVWRIHAERATLTAGIDAPRRRAGAQQLRANLTWRDGAWLVETIAMEDSP